MYDRHRVLQLITETEGAGRLIESRACPHATRQDLIEEPPVGQKVDSGVGSFAVYRAEGVVPVVPHALKGLLGARGTAEIYGGKVRLALYLFRRPLSTLRQWIAF